jgi:1,2-diacylglycerol 3-alpha-glucosyltransferase
MAKSKCVCIFSNFFPPVVSGSSVQVGKLCSELVRKGWTVIVICARTVGGSADYEEVDGVHIYRMPALVIPKALTLGFNFSWLGITFKPANIKRIKVIIEKYQPSIIHLHNYMFDLALSAVLISYLYKIPMVLTVHTFLRHPSPIINILFYLAEQIVLKWLVIGRAKCVICPDMNVVKYAHREFGNVATEMIPYGIHLSNSPANAKKNLKKKFSLEGKRLILSVGHLHAMRNREDLFLAMPLVLKKVPDAVLMIVGDVSVPIPDEVLDCEDTENGVIFAGSLDHTDVSALLGFADLEAHWLNLYEPERTSLGIASLEAMSAGLTILTTANPAIFGDGVLSHGKNIIIVEPHQPDRLAQEIIDLLKNDLRRKTIGKNAHKTIQDHFSWDTIVEQTMEVYEATLDKIDVF